MSHSTVPTNHALVDRFGRSVDYLRVSVTDRCDFRCVYCMSENMQFLPRAQILTLEEMAAIIEAFVELGVKKIRLTGGEPLVRNNILSLCEHVSRLQGLRELVLTSNGSQLSRFAGSLKQAGVKRINISLDSLQAERFQKITRVAKLEQVLAGIHAAKAEGFKSIKLNAVILKHRNHDEILDLVDFAVEQELDISFIEEMPMGQIGSHDRAEAHYPSDQILADIETAYSILPTTEQSGGPARYYRLSAHPHTRVGFISPHSHNFCDTCNRVRLNRRRSFITLSGARAQCGFALHCACLAG